MAKYKLTQDGVQNTATTEFITDNSECREWRKYQKWLAKGNTPDPEFTEDEINQKMQANQIFNLKISYMYFSLYISLLKFLCCIFFLYILHKEHTHLVRCAFQF